MGVPIVGPAMRKVFGTRNERLVKRYLKIVDEVNEHAAAMSTLSDPQLRAKTDEFRKRIEAGEDHHDLLPEVFAVAREVMDRSVGIRNIFNPEKNFDPDRLPDSVRKLYDVVKAEIDKTDDAAPEGDFLGSSEPVPAWQFVDIPAELYEAVRELYPESRPPFRAHPFDVQIVGAVVLYEGTIAEMKTGEGKTIVAPLACYLACVQDQQCHVVTVNDYLVQRDRDWVFPFFRALGLTVGAIHPMHMQPQQEKAKAYQCNVMYGTTSEFGFDYLRDNMKLRTSDQFQKHRDFAIVDEVDSTLIDEARTPLIISGPAHQSQPRYDLADRLARYLVEKQKDWSKADERAQSCMVQISTLEGDIRNARDKSKVPEFKKKLEDAKAKLPELEAERDHHTQYFEVEMDKKKANLTHDGIAEAQKEAGIGSFYVGENMDIPHLLEQSIRAHTVYQRDRDYVVAPDDEGEMSVVIVDQNTGRKMVGRQWSDGLHQAVEAKEGVKIKEQTQTMATVTIQNFFKMYDKLAGMTGTADTEATEFHEIYKLDVVSIPTNVPVIRDDRNDLVFLSIGDKWDAIVEDIKMHHDLGQPVLVGTTSVEKSEELSRMLSRSHNIQHEVLNAKQHEREADIVAGAGQLGSVTIATNMAGRGTDIVLGKFSREQLIDHWKRRDLCSRSVKADMADEEIIAAVYRHIISRELGMRKGEVEKMTDEDIRLALFRHWAVEHAWVEEKKAEKMSEAQLLDALDAGTFRQHRMRVFDNVENMGGLHVVGTERHESRRIDNQLRGRSGRQGDKGSSRFFLSLEDDLMKMFAGNTTLNVLSKLGMKEGDAIEAPMLTRAVEKAQRKVEERNFQIRKNLLDYDEPMDHQRKSFYRMRQRVLQGHNVKEIIFENIQESVRDAVYRYLDRNYVANCIAEWVRENLNVSIDPDRIRSKDREDLHELIRVDAKEEAASNIRVTLGEYMPTETEDADHEQLDLKGLADWANTNFNAGVTILELQDMSRQDIQNRLENAADAMIDQADLAPIDQFLVNLYGEKELAEWANNRFGTDFEASEFEDFEEPEQAVDLILTRAREAYRKREITYPIEFAIQMTTNAMQQDPRQAVSQFCNWANARYELEWSPNALPSTKPAELHERLVKEAEKWDQKRIRERAEKAVAEAPRPEQLDQWMQQTCHLQLTDEEKERAADDAEAVAEEKLTEMLRSELTQFERWVVLQIVDQTWKDHLYSMDQVRDAIGFRAFSQRDPRIEFKRESARLFEEMHSNVRDKVTDLVFKARMTPQAASRGGGRQRPAGDGQADGQQATQAPAQPAVAAAAATASSGGTSSQQRNLEAADKAGSSTSTAVRNKPTPARSKQTVGRNEPCPCGSGKKYKQCHGKRG